MHQYLAVKPLSVNKCYTGVRRKSKHYRQYEKDLNLKLNNEFQLFSKCAKLKLSIEFGLSNRGADLDNCVKVFQDILQKKYLFNDNQIYSLILNKEIIKKGSEYIKYQLEEINS